MTLKCSPIGDILPNMATLLALLFSCFMEGKGARVFHACLLGVRVGRTKIQDGVVPLYSNISASDCQTFHLDGQNDHQQIFDHRQVELAIANAIFEAIFLMIL
jgi:hypothetical protein